MVLVFRGFDSVQSSAQNRGVFNTLKGETNQYKYAHHFGFWGSQSGIDEG
jgi:hypothetical protein